MNGKIASVFIRALLIPLVFWVATVACDEVHEALETCPCVAERDGWKIDCDDQGAMMKAFNFTQDPDNNCLNECQKSGCRINYQIISAHHDYCLHDDVPTEIERAIHDLEGSCIECVIGRKYDPDLTDCENPICSDISTADAAVAALQIHDCTNDCSAVECSAAYKVVRAYHDLCAEDAIPASVERGIHDYEEPCESEGCNTSPALEELKCESSSDGDGLSGGAIAGIVFATLFAVVLIGLVIVLVAVVFILLLKKSKMTWGTEELHA
eukprot:TRINITY_DN3024_c0_g1_i1.p1 TRINITY_DN3024_c0_g1~~TRINITY_DN3024_c0_g1_i1.p1  ORF type:complete len:301 (+),score=18.05 TRINITY_DN3024_c0_g1_i1:102-905(+)